MYQLRRILVPTDFSRHADDALEHAMVLGLRYTAEITLLHVDEFNVLPIAVTMEDLQIHERYRSHADRLFERHFERLQKGMEGSPLQAKVQVTLGRAYKVIVEEAEKGEYDLVVMATRGQTHLSTYLIGSNAERVVRLSRQPVLTIQNAPKREGTVTSVLCPTDFSPAGNVALSYALSIARYNRATLYLQYVSELNQPEPVEEIMRRAPQLADHHPLAAEVNVEYVFDRDVEPSNSIIRFAEDRDVDFIVMSTHGRKGLRRVYIGNNTAEVVRQSTRPVLTVTHPFHRKIFTTTVTRANHPMVQLPDR